MTAPGLTRHDLGREAFVGEVWEWHRQYGRRILEQLRRLGASLDWEREVFTLDPERSRAVVEAFVRLHDAGAVYRGRRMVQWCPQLRTAISDVEVRRGRGAGEGASCVCVSSAGGPVLIVVVVDGRVQSGWFWSPSLPSRGAS